MSFFDCLFKRIGRYRVSPLDQKNGVISPGTERFKTIEDAIETSDSWWRSLDNEDPGFFAEYDLGELIIHLCGSRWKLAEVYNERYPDVEPYTPDTTTYMFTAGGPTPPVHVWLVVKVVGGEVILHKWAAGHELKRVIDWYMNVRRGK